MLCFIYAVAFAPYPRRTHKEQYNGGDVLYQFRFKELKNPGEINVMAVERPSHNMWYTGTIKKTISGRTYITAAAAVGDGREHIRSSFII